MRSRGTPRTSTRRSACSRSAKSHGANAIATYIGNPSAHNLHTMLYLPVFNRALGTKQRYSASTVDQFPKMMSAGLMFGDGLTVPVPDLDRTEYLLILGANPLASNGSLMTAPDVKTRLRDIVRRGGKIVRRRSASQRDRRYRDGARVRPARYRCVLVAGDGQRHVFARTSCAWAAPTGSCEESTSACRVRRGYAPRPSPRSAAASPRR